jgi:3-oxoacyl-[acyl-carrier-protein] synthase-1
MKRVVISGIGIVSCLGNDKNAVLDSLQQGRSGIKFNQQYADIGMRSNVSGSVDINIDDFIDRKVKRFMGDAAAFAYIAMQQAIDDAKLDDSLVSNIRTGIVMGSGGALQPTR